MHLQIPRGVVVYSLYRKKVIYLTFGEKLKRARLDAGLKQAELAKQLNTTGNTISNWENNVSKPDIDTLSYICGILNVSASYFLQAALPKKDDEVTITEMNKIRKYRALDDHGKKMVDMTLEEEWKRSESEKLQLESIQSEKIRHIQYYQRLASAGTGQIVFDDIPVDLVEIPDIPRYKKVKYAIGVNGKSMEPQYNDGETLLVEPTSEIHRNEIGIFIIDGQSLVKKLGNRELISVNDEYDNIPFTEEIRCVGRVIDTLANKSIDEDDISKLNFDTVPTSPEFDSVFMREIKKRQERKA